MTSGPADQTGAVIAELVTAAADVGDQRIQERAEALNMHARRAQLRILVVGSAASGRASIVNALLGHSAVIPVSPMAKAAVAVRIQHGPAMAIELVARDRHRLAVAVSDLRRYLLDPGLEEWCRQIEIAAPLDSLTLCTFQIESLEAGYESADWREALTSSDFVLMVLNAAALLSQAEREFMRDHVAEHGFHRVAVIVTHIDQVPSEERGDIVASVRSFLGRYQSEPAILEVAIDDVIANERHPLRTLLADVQVQSRALRGEALHDAAAALLEQIKRTVTADLALMTIEADRIEDARATLAARQEWLRTRIERVQHQIDAFIGTLLREQVQSEIRDFGEVVQRRLPAEIRSVDDLGDIRQHLPGYIETVWAEFLERRMTVAQAALIEEVDRVEARIDDDLDELVRVMERRLDGETHELSSGGRLRAFVMPRRGESHAGSIAHRLSLHAFIMLILAGILGFSPLSGLLSLGVSHAIRRFFKRDIETADREAIIQAALAAARDLERELVVQVGVQLERAASEIRQEAEAQYLDAVKRIDEIIDTATGPTEVREKRRLRLQNLLSTTIPDLERRSREREPQEAEVR